jgi:moderate conductance mechanosensitive channel
VLVSRAVRWCADRLTARSARREATAREQGLVPTERTKHERAVIQVVSWSLICLVFFTSAITILGLFNVPLTSLVAPATVAGVAVGFGAQRIAQDVFSGFFLVTERQYGFGDVVRIGNPGETTGIAGTVEELTLRTTKLRAINGELIVIPNGEIRQVTNLSKDWARVVLDLPLPVDVDVVAVTALLHQIGDDLRCDEQWAPLLLDTPSVMGIETIAVGFLNLRFVARTLPGKQWEVGREIRHRVAATLRDKGIVVPTSLLATAPPS